MSPRITLCVFCSSSEAVDGRLRAVAAQLGTDVAERGWRLVYGGGDVGLMGEVARSALAAGAHVTGVIPYRLAEREVALGQVTELIYVDTMRERKRLMDERADAFVVLPGGIGTLEELMEVLSLKQLGFHGRPIILLDPDEFWEPLHRQLEVIVGAGLAVPGILRLFRRTVAVDETLDLIAAELGDPVTVVDPEPATLDDGASPQR